jgi:hypothetical protein
MTPQWQRAARDLACNIGINPPPRISVEGLERILTIARKRRIDLCTLILHAERALIELQAKPNGYRHNGHAD